MISKSERLIPLDDEPPRGWLVLGELDTVDGPRLHLIHWRRQKRLDHQAARDLDRLFIAHRTRGGILDRIETENVTNG